MNQGYESFKNRGKDQGKNSRVGGEIVVQSRRHHLMEEEERPYVKEKEDEIALDRELELNRQARYDSEDILRMDINELTKSNNYHRVNTKLMEKMFNMPGFKTMCLWTNLNSIFNYIWMPLKGVLITTSIIALAIYGLTFLSWGTTTPWNLGAPVLLFVVGGVLEYAFALYASIWFKKNKLKLLKARMVSEDVRETEVRMPYGAKLKLKEAVDTKIFISFNINYPTMAEDDYGFIPTMKTDPAITGKTEDGRYYMVCWWDVANDIDKVETKIKMFKKFKVEV